VIAALALAALALVPVQRPERVVVAFVPGVAWEAPGAAVGALVPYDGCPAEVAATLAAGDRVTVDCGVPITSFTVPSGARLLDLTALPSLDAALVALPEDADRTLLISVAPRGHLGGVALLPGEGLLRGDTRRDGLVALPDLTRYLAGEPVLDTVPGSVSDVRALARREHLHRPYHGVFHTGLIALPMLLYIWLGFGRRRAGPGERRIALALATYPAAGFLASALPWWRVPWAGAAAVASVVAAMGALLAVGALAARLLRAPVEVGVAGAIALVLGLDLAAGGYLQETGIASYSAVAGGRFHGIGNAGFAVLATAAVVALGAAAARYGARAWLALVPLVALVGAPRWGADFGGALTLTAVLVVALARRPRAVVLGVVAGLAVALAVAVLDYRTDDPSHLGRFVADVLDGTWTETVGRKASAAGHSVFTWFPLLVAGSAAYALSRRFAHPTVAPLVVLWAVGSLVNDTGLVVAACGMAVAVPLLLSYTERPA
jgi:hypothetical protein